MVVRLQQLGRRHTRRSTSSQIVVIPFLLYCTCYLIGSYRRSRDIVSSILDSALDGYAVLPAISSSSLQSGGATDGVSPFTPNKQLDSISWPQVDDRIEKALRNGHSIMPTIHYTTEFDGNNKTKRTYMFNNTKYEAPPEKLATVVSCIYETSYKHPGQHYSEWLSNMLHVTDPMIIFLDRRIDPESGIDWYELVRSQRQHAPTIIATLPFTNLTMQTQFDESFWEQQRPPDSKSGKKKPSYRVYNEKMLLIKEVAMQNPFGTELFVWVDAGYFRGRYRPIHGVIVRNNITKNGIPPNKVLLPQMNKEPAKQEVAANVWGGTKEAILKMHEKYWLSFWGTVTKGLSVCFEQRVMITMCRSWPDICFLFYSGRDDDWFGLGKSYIRDPNFNFRKFEYAVDVDGGNPENVPKKIRDSTILPTTVVNGTVVFPEGGRVVTGDSIAKYYETK